MEVYIVKIKDKIGTFQIVSIFGIGISHDNARYMPTFFTPIQYILLYNNVQNSSAFIGQKP
jgi:hypothetical protein